MKNHFNEILLRDKIYFFRKRKKRYFQFYQLSIRMVFFSKQKISFSFHFSLSVNK